jgi:hypothetical protein
MQRAPIVSGVAGSLGRLPHTPGRILEVSAHEAGLG